MLNVTRVLLLLAFAGIAVAAVWGAELQNTRPPSGGDPLAQTQEKPVAFRPIGERNKKSVYLRGQETVGERVFYKNGQVAEERLFKDGRLNDTTRLFYESGRLFAEQPYEDGKLNGAVRYYKENGELLGESKFDHGTGVLHQFPLASLLLAEAEIPYKNGVRNGTMREWGRFNGGKGIGCDVSSYSNGEMDGWAITFDEDGTVLRSAYFRKDRTHGAIREYDSKGKMKKGFPSFRIDGNQVAETVYREAAKTDEILAKSLASDAEGVEWGRKSLSMPKVGTTQPAGSISPAK
jgi:antitoxin component YwqK of YwqJK toxin-antitoxin module